MLIRRFSKCSVKLVHGLILLHFVSESLLLANINARTFFRLMKYSSVTHYCAVRIKYAKLQ